MCYVTLESVLIEESRGPKHNRLGLSKALHPSSIHCCHLQDPFMYPCVLSFRPVRSSVSSAMGFTLPAKYLQRESCRSRGDSTSDPIEHSLSTLLSQSATVCLVSVRALNLIMPKGVDEAQTVEYEDVFLQGKR